MKKDWIRTQSANIECLLLPAIRIQTQRAVENFTISGCQAYSRPILANGMIKAGAAADFEMKLIAQKAPERSRALLKTRSKECGMRSLSSMCIGQGLAR